ncbi:MAG: glycosidase, partial [Lentisphaeria bacterium]|nr:glycosidase [Lentisphaeria bacterium]
PSKVIYSPGGYFLAPWNEERVGDVSNVVFSNGLVARADGKVFLYYASSDTRIHVATTDIDRILDWVKNTPSDPLTSRKCVEQRIELIRKNEAFNA